MKNKLFKKKCQTGTVLPPKGAYENRQYFGLPDTMTRDEFSQLTPQQIQDSIKAFNAKQMEGVKGVVGDTISRQPYNFQKETTQYSQIPVAKQTFQEAYAAAKNQGLSQFMFEGRPIAVKDDPNFRSPSQQLQPEYKTIQTSNTTTIPFKPENMRNQTGGDQSQQIMEVVMQALQQGKKPEEILQALVQSGMDEAQATQIIQQIMQQGQQQSQTGDLASRMGFRFDSPYQYNKSLNINTPQGLIDMSKTPYPLFAQADNGMSKYMAPYSGMHDFGNASKVRETRMAQMGGEMQQPQQGMQQEQGGDQEQIIQMIAQALQEGKSPEEIMQALVEAGVPQEQAQQMIQQVMSQMQGQQQQQQPQDSSGLQMQMGGRNSDGQIPSPANDLYMQANMTPEQAMVMSEQEALQPSMMISEATPSDPLMDKKYLKFRGGNMYRDYDVLPSPTEIKHSYFHLDPQGYEKKLNTQEKKEASSVVKAAQEVVGANNNITTFQTALNNYRIANNKTPIKVNGTYDKVMADAVLEYQKERGGLKVDGIAGKNTIADLGLDMPSLEKSMLPTAKIYSNRVKNGATTKKEDDKITTETIVKGSLKDHIAYLKEYEIPGDDNIQPKQEEYLNKLPASVKKEVYNEYMKQDPSKLRVDYAAFAKYLSALPVQNTSWWNDQVTSTFDAKKLTKGERIAVLRLMKPLLEKKGYKLPVD